jgi:hypothetical protein
MPSFNDKTDSAARERRSRLTLSVLLERRDSRFDRRRELQEAFNI